MGSRGRAFPRVSRAMARVRFAYKRAGFTSDQCQRVTRNHRNHRGRLSLFPTQTWWEPSNLPTIIGYRRKCNRRRRRRGGVDKCRIFDRSAGKVILWAVPFSYFSLLVVSIFFFFFLWKDFQFFQILLNRIKLDFRAENLKFVWRAMEGGIDQILFLLFFGSVRKRHEANRDRSVSLALAARSTRENRRSLAVKWVVGEEIAARCVRDRTMRTK